MSEMPLNASQDQAGTMPVQAGWYTVVKPGKVLGPQGQRAMEPIGMYPDLGSANAASAKIPGAWLILNVVVFVQPDTVNLKPV